jgi:predicted O-methyltransferase YrrM
MLDERVRAVLARLEREDAEERAAGVARELRSRQVAPTTGRFLFALVAPQTDCEVLEIGGSRGYSTIWLAAGVRYLGGRVLSLEHDPVKCEAWRRNVAEAGVEGTAELLEGDAFETLRAIDDVFDVVFLDAEKAQYEELFQLARGKLEPGALVVADNVLSHEDTLGAYSAARQADPTLESVTVPLDRGLELTVVLREADAWPPPAARTATVGLPRKGGGPT